MATFGLRRTDGAFFIFVREVKTDRLDGDFFGQTRGGRRA
jgi:hypothetical protein